MGVSFCTIYVIIFTFIFVGFINQPTNLYSLKSLVIMNMIGGNILRRNGKPRMFRKQQSVLPLKDLEVDFSHLVSKTKLHRKKRNCVKTNPKDYSSGQN